MRAVRVAAVSRLLAVTSHNSPLSHTLAYTHVSLDSNTTAYHAADSVRGYALLHCIQPHDCRQIFDLGLFVLEFHLNVCSPQTTETATYCPLVYVSCSWTCTHGFEGHSLYVGSHALCCGDGMYDQRGRRF